MSPALKATLEDVWQACLRLPNENSSFDSLSPDERREAHDIGVRIQDRLLITLSRLVDGMASDGVELVADDGVPRALSSQPTDSAQPSDTSPSSEQN